MLKLLLSGMVLLSGITLSGCSSSRDYNPSMDYNPGWDMESKTSFDDIPRHKNSLEHGIE